MYNIVCVAMPYILCGGKVHIREIVVPIFVISIARLLHREVSSAQVSSALDGILSNPPECLLLGHHNADAVVLITVRVWVFPRQCKYKPTCLRLDAKVGGNDPIRKDGTEAILDVQHYVLALLRRKVHHRVPPVQPVVPAMVVVRAHL